MKKHILIVSLAAASTLFTACNEQYNTTNITNQQEASAEAYYAPTFAEPDDAKRLTGTPAENLRAIFEATGPEIITSMGNMNITNEQYEEIAAFTTKLVEGKKTQKEKFNVIHNWVNGNVKYDPSDNDPYAVFTNKTGVCQGYANLLTVMCYSQDIPTVVVNGYLNQPPFYGAHAWNYVCADGKWYVADPTNGNLQNGTWSIANISRYTHLIPEVADVDIFTDDYAIYRYYNYSINVAEVTTKESPLIVPYSVGGFVISSFNPSVALPEDITEIYLGENITTLGESYNMSLTTSNYGKYLRAIYVDKNNPSLADHEGVVYRKNGDERQLYYIPGGMEFIEMLPMEVVDKNTIYNHNSVKEIYFPKGTKRLESFAIENCPKLERVYVPEDAEVSSSAIYNCPSNVKILRGVPSSIKHVTM